MDDYLQERQALEAAERARREKKEADWQAKKALEAEYDDAWKAAIKACAAGDEQPDTMPDLTAVVALAELLRKRGWHEWLPAMAENQKEPPGQSDPIIYRAGCYWMVRLIQAALLSEHAEQLLPAYQSHKSDKRHWRAQAAIDVQYFFFLRIGTNPPSPKPPEPDIAPAIPPGPPVLECELEKESPRGKNARALLAALLAHHVYDGPESMLADVATLSVVDAARILKIDKGSVSRAFDQLFPESEGWKGYKRYCTLDRGTLLTHFLNLAGDRQELQSLSVNADIGSKLA